MGEPTFWDNPEAAQKITQELNDVKSGIETYKNLLTKFDDVQILLELALEEQDDSQEADIAAEIAEIEKGLENLRLEIMLSEPYDANNAILTLHAGAGGTEAQDWTQMLLRMYVRWAERHGYKTEVVDVSGTITAGGVSGAFSIVILTLLFVSEIVNVVILSLITYPFGASVSSIVYVPFAKFLIT